MTLAYSTELSADQYRLLESLLPAPASCGRPRTVNLQSVTQHPKVFTVLS